MAGENTITVAGNVTADPELRFTPNGAAVVNFTVACTPRYRDQTTGKWVDGDTMYYRCNAWRDMAENVAESLTRGLRVMVTGRLRMRDWESRDGQKRQSLELEVDEIGASLKWATAKVNKLTRTGTEQPAAQPTGETGAEPAMAGAATGDNPPF